MANDLQAEWNLFRRYRFERMTIEERADHIHFGQRLWATDPRMQKPSTLARIITAVVLFVPPIFSAMAGSYLAATIYFLSVLMIFAVVAIGRALWGRSVYLDIYARSVVYTEGKKQTSIKFDEIKNIDVRAHDRMFSIYVWYHNIPIQTFSQRVDATAISLKEGIALAIGLMNQRPAPLSPEPRQQRAQTRFVE